MGLTKKAAKREIPEEEKIPSPELIKIKEELQALKDANFFKENPEEYKKISRQTYKDLCSFFINDGAEFVIDVNDIYKSYNNRTPLIVRKEDPEKVAALNENFDINLSFDPKVVAERGDKYVNCAIWPYGNTAVAGIKNAFLEGRGMAGPLASVIGIRQNPKNTEITIPHDFMLKVGDIEREAVRIASGTITKEDLEFIILRIQKDFFPAESLMEGEKNESIKQIFRAFKF